MAQTTIEELGTGEKLPQLYISNKKGLYGENLAADISTKKADSVWARAMEYTTSRKTFDLSEPYKKGSEVWDERTVTDVLLRYKLLGVRLTRRTNNELTKSADYHFGSLTKAKEKVGIEYYKKWTKGEVLKELMELKERGINPNSTYNGSLTGAARTNYGSWDAAKKAAGIKSLRLRLDKSPEIFWEIEGMIGNDSLTTVEILKKLLGKDASKTYQSVHYIVKEAKNISHLRSGRTNFHYVTKEGRKNAESRVTELEHTYDKKVDQILDYLQEPMTLERLSEKKIDQNVLKKLREEGKIIVSKMPKPNPFKKYGKGSTGRVFSKAGPNYAIRAGNEENFIKPVLKELENEDGSLDRGYMYSLRVRFGKNKILLRVLDKVYSESYLKQKFIDGKTYGKLGAEEVLEQLKELKRNGINPSSIYDRNLERFAKIHFGSWNKAKEAVGLPIKVPIIDMDKDDIIEKLKYYEKNGITSSTKFDKQTLTASIRVFGSVYKAKEAAGVKQLLSHQPGYWNRGKVLEILRKYKKRGENPSFHDNAELGYAAIRYFGSWDTAKKVAGLKLLHKNYKEPVYKSKKDVLNKLRQHLKFGVNVAPRTDYALRYAAEKFFPSWADAKEAAGFDKTTLMRVRYGKNTLSKNEVLEKLKYLKRNGINPSFRYDKTLGSSARSHFGSWNNAKEAAGLEKFTFNVPIGKGKIEPRNIERI